MSKAIAVIGMGSWGTALAVHLAKKGYSIKAWVYESEIYESIITKRENPRYLPGVMIPQNVDPVMDKGEAVSGAETVVLAVPSQFVRMMARSLAPFLKKDQIIVNVAKGLESDTLKRLSQVIREEIADNDIVVLSGPSHAEEVGRDIPTVVVCASESRKAAEKVQDTFMSPNFRVYTNPDVIGVETGGALKNIIALAAGISDGLGYGDNTKAALMTRGIAEIARLGQAMGASILTFAGLTGIGDLIVTCTSMHSRNRRAGIMLGQGKSLDETLKAIGMVVEGVKTCEAAYKLSMKMGIEMPITEQLYRILYDNKDPASAVSELMMRSKTHESEEIVNSIDTGWL
ncbi:MAG TPA: NAD(P)H-dependent glycerol-3-phosphate dehydrogenase [Candidatus Atribacteria bacterium]|nr:NAD(P)H-dependent glycerol-3-phosphate dehydrogenase [Candidatus Atribacteria bacterium]